jgi:hypothetical protein
VYVPWRVGNKRSQKESYDHYRIFYGTTVHFTSFTDLDEYIYSPSGQYLPSLLGRYEQENYGIVRMLARYFVHRMCLPNGKLGIEQFNSTVRVLLNTTIKVIVRNSLILQPGIHCRTIKNGRELDFDESGPDLTFMHYKITTNRFDTPEKK